MEEVVKTEVTEGNGSKDRPERRKGMPLYPPEVVEKILAEAAQAAVAREVADRYGVSLQWIYRQRGQARKKRRQGGVKVAPKPELPEASAPPPEKGVAMSRAELRRLHELVGRLSAENVELRASLKELIGRLGQHAATSEPSAK